MSDMLTFEVNIGLAGVPILPFYVIALLGLLLYVDTIFTNSDEMAIVTRGQTDLAKAARMHDTQLSRVTDRLTDRHRDHL